MGTTKKTRPIRRPGSSRSLADALFSKVRQRVIGVLFGRPDRSFYANEIISIARSGTGAVQRELERLAASGIITASRVGNQKHYQANAGSPVFEELRGIALKTFALVDVLRGALVPHSEQIRAAFVYGSIAKNSDTASSDIDLMIVAEGLTYADLFVAVDGLSHELGRKVAPTIYSPDEWRRRLRQSNAFATKVSAGPRLFIIGDERSLSA